MKENIQIRKILDPVSTLGSHIFPLESSIHVHYYTSRVLDQGTEGTVVLVTVVSYCMGWIQVISSMFVVGGLNTVKMI